MKYLLWSLVTLVVILGLMTVIGYLLPVAHTASRDALIAAPAPDVFATISDVVRYPDWWSDISRVEMLTADGGRVRFREHMSSGPGGDGSGAGHHTITFRDPNRRCRPAVRRHVDVRAGPGRLGHARYDHRARRGLQPDLPVHVAVHLRLHRDDGKLPGGPEPQVSNALRRPAAGVARSLRSRGMAAFGRGRGLRPRTGTTHERPRRLPNDVSPPMRESGWPFPRAKRVAPGSKTRLPGPQARPLRNSLHSRLV